MSKFKKGDLVCVYTDPEACGIVTKIGHPCGLVWVHWFETRKTTDVYSRILIPLDHLTFA